MSWLFGIKSDPAPDLGSISVNQTPSGSGSPPEGQSGGGGSDSGSKDGKSMSYRFDSTALERAAKAARELEQSPNAKQYLELAKLQEQNLMVEKQTKMKEYEAHIENAKSEQIRVQQEERRKTIAEETKHNQARAQYQDQLARKRYEDQLIQQQKANEENLRKQEESLAKQEAMRRATLEKEMDIRNKSELQRIEAKVRAKAKVERENQDLYLEQIRLKAAEKRTTVIESLKTAGSILGTGFNAFISDKSKVATSVGALTVLVLGYYSVKRGTGVISRYVEARLKKPTLVQETSRVNLVEALKHPIKTTKMITRKPKDVLQGVILPPALEEVLSEITVATRNTKKNKGTYKNLLLQGPPGTGKTLFAKRLAHYCGMDYAIMSGGSVTSMSEEGVRALSKVFDWANSSRRGLILFVDEAESFLRKRRSREIMSENMRATLSEFLFRTGEQSDRFMLCLATNTPEQLDWAVNNRMNEVIEFPLPGLSERERMIRLYFDKFVLIPAMEGKRFKVEQFDYGLTCSDIAKITEGFAGRDIVNLANDWQQAAYSSDDGVLTKEKIMAKVKRARMQLGLKSKYLIKEEKEVFDQVSDSTPTDNLKSSPS